MLAPEHYTLLTQAGDFHCRQGSWSTCQQLLGKAIQLVPAHPRAYRVLAANLIREGNGREGHRVAVVGLARSRPDADLWGLVSEAYILRGDFPAAIRAREVALGLNPTSVYNWERMAYIRENMGDTLGAREASRRARSLGEGGAPAESGDPWERSP